MEALYVARARGAAIVRQQGVTFDAADEASRALVEQACVDLWEWRCSSGEIRRAAFRRLGNRA